MKETPLYTFDEISNFFQSATDDWTEIQRRELTPKLLQMLFTLSKCRLLVIESSAEFLSEDELWKVTFQWSGIDWENEHEVDLFTPTISADIPTAIQPLNCRINFLRRYKLYPIPLPGPLEICITDERLIRAAKELAFLKVISTAPKTTGKSIVSPVEIPSEWSLLIPRIAKVSAEPKKVIEKAIASKLTTVKVGAVIAATDPKLSWDEVCHAQNCSERSIRRWAKLVDISIPPRPKGRKK